MKAHYLLAAFIFIAVNSVSAGIDVEKIRQKLAKILHEKSIPPQVAKWIAVLEDSIDLLRCVPTIRHGNCYKSTPCQVPKLKFDKVISIVLTICKNPYKIIIDFMPLDLPWYAKLDLHPVVINFDNNEKNGIFAVHSDTTIKAHVKHTHFHTAKARFIIDSAIRYDCTKPKGNSNWMQRAAYNLGAPSKQYNKIFYHMKVRIEVKVKHFHWGRFDYKCKKCKDLVNKSGVVGSGPTSCITEVNKYLAYERKVIQGYRRRYHNCGGLFGWIACMQACKREKKIPANRCSRTRP